MAQLPDREWRVGEIEFTGNDEIPEGDLLIAISTKERAWYAVWRPRPEFDPISFETDLTRLRRLYESRGFYDTSITYELRPRDDDVVVDIEITIDEDGSVKVARIAVDDGGYTLPPGGPPLLNLIPFVIGDRFTEEAYKTGEDALRTYFLKRGYAWVEVKRRARVDVENNTAEVWYSVEPGVIAVFGDTRFEGTEDVSPDIIRSTLTYDAGETFSIDKVLETRTELLALGLFDAVDIKADPDARGGAVAPMIVSLVEGPPRSFKIGVTYNTEDAFGGEIQWEHLNWLGGGRRLTLAVKGTQYNSYARAKLIQPHFLWPSANGILEAVQQIDNESTYLLTSTQGLPRLEAGIVSKLSGFVGYRAEYDDLSNVDASVVQAIGPVRTHGVLSAPQLGLVWNSTIDRLNPQQGEILTLTAEQAGAIWGGEYEFWKVAAEGRKYFPIGWKTILATRLKIGLADSIGAEENLPLFDRFYAGGQNSVRGYARRMLGPLSSTNKPLGGLTLFEGSLELRRPIYEIVGGALFVDFGQVSLDAFDIPVSTTKFAVGPGLLVDTPVGPLVLDVGFPIDAPPGERGWQLHFSVGQFF